MRDVVITGLGMVSPIGIGSEPFWAALRQGRSGVRNLPWLVDTPAEVKFGADVRDFDAKQYVKPRKSLKVMSREIQMGFAAAAMAMEQARLAAGAVEPLRFGVVLGSEMFFCDLDEVEDAFRRCAEGGEFEFEQWGPRGMGQLYPLWMLKYLPNMAACHIGIAYDAQGPNNTIVQGEASSLLALIESARVIQRGHGDVMITGGTGSRINITPFVYRGTLQLSRRSDEPERASRPFDRRRDGMVNGEGAGALVLETQQHAAARGARILARVVGFASGFEPPQVRAGSVLAGVMRQALRSAGLQPDQIGHVNAHGISLPVEDAGEAQAIREVLGDVPVTAPKSFFGNLGAGGGAVEMAASVLALEHQEVPVTLNYEEPDPECPVHVVHGEPLRGRQQAAMVLSRSSTGQVAAVVIAAA